MKRPLRLLTRDNMMENHTFVDALTRVVTELELKDSVNILCFKDEDTGQDILLLVAGTDGHIAYISERLGLEVIGI